MENPERLVKTLDAIVKNGLAPDKSILPINAEFVRWLVSYAWQPRVLYLPNIFRMARETCLKELIGTQ
jgi:hypothetical protein